MSSGESDENEISLNGNRPRRSIHPRRTASGQKRPEATASARPVEEEKARKDPGSPGAPPSGSSEPTMGWTFRDFMVPYILLALSMQRAHGYFIEQYLRGLGMANVEMSTLYRTLRQLEKDGLVWSTWEPGPDGPARRIYSLTDAGRWWLDAGASALAGYRSLIDRFFGRYPGPTSEPKNARKDNEDR